MKKRYCCQVAAVVITFLFLVYHVGGAQYFAALQVSELESQVTEGEWITIQGSVYKKLRKENGFDFYLKPENQKEFVYVSMSDINLSEKEIMKTGQTVCVSGETVLFEDAPNLGNFNQKFYYQKQNIYVKLQDSSVKILDQETPVTAFLKEKVWEIQQSLTDTIVFYLGETYGGMLSAIVLGEDVFVDDELKELFQKSGIGHLLAISGLHISFIGTGIYHFMRKWRLPISVSAVCSGIFLTIYMFMIGNRTSALRAWVMFLLQMGAQITGREYDGKTAIAVASLVVLAKEPVLLFDAGFLLSFGAVLGIYVVTPVLKMKVPLAIQCVLLPVQLYYYYEICIYSLLWNLFAIPLSALLFGSGIIGIICSRISFIPEIFIKGAFGMGGLILWFYEKGSQFILALPCARWVIGQPSFVWIIIYYVVLFICILRKKRKWPVMAVGILLILAVKWPSDHLKIAMLNVDQGDSFFLQGPEGGTYLIDGGSSGVTQVGKYRIEPYLKQQGVGTLDYVWVTHGDSDHMNGILEMIERQNVGVKIKTLILPPKSCWNENINELIYASKKAGIDIYIMSQGQILQEGEMTIKCLWPVRTVEGLEENQASTVLSLSYQSFDMLLTGDLEKEAEEEVAEYINTCQKKHLLSDSYEVLNPLLAI